MSRRTASLLPWARSLALVLGWLILAVHPARAVPVPAPYTIINNQGVTDPNIELTLEVVDAASATTVITFKGDYAKQAAQLAFPNPWVLSGTGDGNKHIFRDAQLTKLVKTLSEIFSNGKQQATVHDAALHAVKRDEEWDVTLATDVTFNGARKAESKKIFHLAPLMLGAEESGKALVKAYGPFMDGARRANANPKSSVREVDEAMFVKILVANSEDPVANQGTFGITDRRGPRPVSYIRPGAPPYTVVHEVTHLYQNPEFRQLGQGVSEGFTHFLAEIAVTNNDGEAPYDFSKEYIAEVKFVHALLPLAGFDLAKKAYFGTGTVGIEAMRAAVDAKKGAGAFDRICALIKGKPTASDIQELRRLLH